MNKTKTLLLAISLIAAFTLGNTAIADLIKQYVIPATGTLKTVEVSITWLNGTAVTSISWGAVENETAYTLPDPLNITNISNTPATLTLSTANLSPSIISLSLTWNYTGTTLNPDEHVIVELTQTVTATDSYTYDVIIAASSP